MSFQMISITPYNKYTQTAPATFCGNFVVKKANLFERYRLNYLSLSSIIDDPRNNLKGLKANIALTALLHAINPKFDAYCLFDKTRKIVGGYTGYNNPMYYHVNTMFLDKAIRCKKSAIVALGQIQEKIKERAIQGHKSLISCFVSARNNSNQRLYKRIGFDDSYATEDEFGFIKLISTTKDFGRNVKKILKKVNLE